ncbi:MAG: hypothetical protein QT00_C0001G0463 [archaeon GW2011_AR5]|nr:MAG: hypothetical protein QT00_C0001G0463 [archaeon GW2011_AR5]MBS3051576.1 hypothetical protein [Candidatus Aenigmarchaeota archaeon]
MLDKIRQKLISKINFTITEQRINEIMETIKSKVDENKIINFFISYTNENYGAWSDTPIQIDIITTKFLIELKVGSDALRYDYTPLSDLGTPIVERKPTNVKVTFVMKIPNLTTVISTNKNEEFLDLLNFVESYVTLAIR